MKPLDCKQLNYVYFIALILVL